ncbi:MAG TPA: DNA polymerase III subunit alpha [Fimbriimonas sp.]|nr:DNA polymerase III subunit alpha [Fimbriimonas sp.]
MRPAGHETLELWRESGEWWANEEPREFESFVDKQGVRRVRSSALTYHGCEARIRSTAEEDYSEEISLQKAARRMRGWGEYSSPATYESYKAKDVRRLASVSEPVAFSTRTTAPPYVPLHLLSGYAFGRALIHASDLPALAAMRGLEAAAITDPFSLVGAVEFARAAKKIGIKPLIGASFELESSVPTRLCCTSGSFVLLARSKLGYQSLSKLITQCHLEEPRLFPLCRWNRLRACARDLICLTGGDGGPINQLLTHGDLAGAGEALEELICIFGRENVYIEIERCFVPWERRVNRLLLELAEKHRLTPVAGGLVCHENPEHFPAQDVLVCSDTLCLVEEIIGRKPAREESQPQVKCRPARHLNSERYFRSAEEMSALFADAPFLLDNTRHVADRCDADVLPGRTRLPRIYDDDNARLYYETWEGARSRHKRIPTDLKKRLDHELNRIASLGYSGHFLTIWNACEWAREQQILFSGRGSVVDSAVAYCLGLSRIDAYAHKLHFDRFLPADGSKRPDIDIDFEAHRRDDIRSYLRRKYGDEHVATVAAIGTYGTRGIIREVGKAMGLPEPIIGQFAKLIHGGVSPEYLETALDTRPELRDSGISREKFKWIMDLAPLIDDIPRNMRAHSSGVVISDEPLYHTVPVMFSGVEDVPILQWDKRSAKHYFDKFDVLCLRGQDVLSGTQERIRVQNKGFDVEQISLDDEETYRNMRSGALIGIPQSASPAMRQAHIRLRTSNLHDASLVQAGIRPGVGGAVKLNELIARRRGKPYSYLHPKFEEILGLTYGIIVFQEQVDQLLQTFGGYSCGEAESIREAIHENRKRDYGREIKDELYERVERNGYTKEIADHVYDLVAGFKGYGFAQGHALAFAEVSLRSIHCQQNYPAEYFASLLDAQPAGYYGPCTLVNEARCRGVAILPVDINKSDLKFKVEDVKSELDPKIIMPNAGIRVAFTQVGGISTETRGRITAERSHFFSFFDFVLRVNPDRDELERLILCGAFDSLHINRRALLWAIPKAYDYAGSARAMSQGLGMTLPEPEIDKEIDDFYDHEKALYERAILGLDVKHHLMEFERERITEKGVVKGSEIDNMKSGQQAIVVGNPIRLRFPPTASGKRVVFFDLEDESGLLNVTCFDDVYRRDGHAIVTSAYVTIRGEAQDRDGHMAFLAHRIFPYKPKLNLEGIAHIDKLFETADFLAK